MSSTNVTVLPAKQQHMLFLFVPITKGLLHSGSDLITKLNLTVNAAVPDDSRKTRGVHFFMAYPHVEGTPTPGLPHGKDAHGNDYIGAGFKSYPGKDVLVVMSIYDTDFAPYISAFFEEPVLGGLDALMYAMDETNIPGVDPNGLTSAKYIREHHGVKANAQAFYCLLMRYNFGDPLLPAGGTKSTDRYTLGAGFPGLTVADIINNYPDAATSWPPPSDPQNAYTFPSGVAPICKV
jgi:hypothetical protein